MRCLALYLGDEAEAWLREAVRASTGADSLHDLDQTDRALAFQRTIVAFQLLQADGIPLDMIGPDGNRDYLLWPSGSIEEPEPDAPYRHERIAAAFSRAFNAKVALCGE